MHVHTHTHTHTHTRACRDLHTHTHIHTYMNMCLHPERGRQTETETHTGGGTGRKTINKSTHIYKLRLDFPLQESWAGFPTYPYCSSATNTSRSRYHIMKYLTTCFVTDHLLCSPPPPPPFFLLFLSTEAPGKPVGPITFSQILADSVTLAWSPPKKDGGSPVASYTIELTEDGGRNWKAVDSVEAPSTVYTAKGLKEGQDYKFRVSAVNKVGPGEPLVSDSVTPQRKIGMYPCAFVFLVCSLDFLQRNPWGMPGFLVRR